MIRFKQKIPKGKWFTWLLMAGRGFGKTFAGSFAVAELIKSNTVKKVALIGKTIFDARNTMVNNGIMKFLSVEYKHNISGKCIKNNSEIVCYLFSSLNPNILRGFSFDLVWIDEFASFKYAEEIWTQVLLCLRVGFSKVIITTTPKPISILKEIIQLPDTKVITGTSYENSKNLSKKFVQNLKNMENSVIGRQEVLGEMIDQYSLWKPEDIQYAALPNNHNVSFFLGVDPAVTVGTTGMILIGVIGNIAYVIDDFSTKLSSIEWMNQILNISKQYNNLTIVLEINQGGFILKDILIKMGVKCDIICQTAMKDKMHRNIPTYLLYKKRIVFHTQKLVYLENEMLYEQRDRVDALTWALYPFTNYSSFTIDIIY